MKKKTICKLCGLFFLFAILFGVGIYFVITTTNKESSNEDLPYIQDVEDWTQYSSDELEDIIRKSSFDKIGKFTYNMSEDELNSFKEKCPYVTDKNANTVYYKANEDDEEWSSYDCSVMDYVEKIKEDVLREEKDQLLQMAEEEGSELSQLDTDGIFGYGAEQASRYKTLAEFRDYCQSKNKRLTSVVTSFYLGFFTVGDQKRITDAGTPGKKFSNMDDMSSLEDKEKKALFSTEKFAKVKGDNGEFDVMFGKAQGKVNRIKITVHVSDTTLDGSTRVTDTVATWPKDGSVNNILKKYYDFSFSEGRLVASTYTAKSHPQVYHKGKYRGRIADNDGTIFYFTFKYRTPNNCAFYTSDTFNKAAIGRFCTFKYVTETVNGVKLDMSFDKDNETMGDNESRKLTSEGLYLKNEDAVKMQVNLSNNTSNGTFKTMLENYFDYWCNTKNKKDAYVKEQCNNAYNESSAESSIAWVKDVILDGNDWSKEGATKYMMFTPEYSGVGFEYLENNGTDGTDDSTLKSSQNVIIKSKSEIDSVFNPTYDGVEEKRYAANGSTMVLVGSGGSGETTDLRNWYYTDSTTHKKYTVNRILLKRGASTTTIGNFYNKSKGKDPEKAVDRVVLYADKEKRANDYNNSIMKKNNDFDLSHYRYMYACNDGSSFTASSANNNSNYQILTVVYDVEETDEEVTPTPTTTGTTPTPPIETNPPSDDDDDDDDDDGNVDNDPIGGSASGSFHTGHKFTESEALQLCPKVGTPTVSFSAYEQTSVDIKEELVEGNGYLDHRLKDELSAKFTKLTTFTFHFRHVHQSSCSCSGRDRYLGNSGYPSYISYYGPCGNPYCRCSYEATKTVVKSAKSYFNFTISNCKPEVSVKNVLNKTEADVIRWSDVIDMIDYIKDHEDMNIHNGSGSSTCNTCLASSKEYPKVWSSQSDVTGSMTFKYSTEYSGVGKNTAEITIDIGKLKLDQQNPGGKYPITVTVVDSDEATESAEFTIDIDWVAPTVNYTSDYNSNGLIYNTNDIISQLDFYNYKVLRPVDVLNVNGGTCDYDGSTMNKGDLAKGWDAGSKYNTTDLLASNFRDGSNYPKYIRIVSTTVSTPLYVALKGQETALSSNNVCSIQNGTIYSNGQVSYPDKDGIPSNAWRECNSVVSQKVCQVTLRAYNPRNFEYYTDVTVNVLVKNDVPQIEAGNHLLTLYEHYSDDLIISWPSTKAWDYEDEMGSRCKNSVGSSANGTGKAKVNGYDWNNNSYTTRNSASGSVSGINKTNYTVLQPQCISSGNLSIPRRNNGLTFMDRFVVVDWGGLVVTSNGIPYYNTNNEGTHPITIRYYDQDGAYADVRVNVQVKKTEAQMTENIRFINKYFLNQPETFGGIANDSIWSSTSSQRNSYYNVLKNSLDKDVSNASSSNGWANCLRVYLYDKTDVREAKNIVKNHVQNQSGFSNSTEYTSGLDYNGSVWNFNNEFISWMNKHRVK